MKANQRKQLREKSTAELDVLARDAAKTLFNMRNNKSTGEVEKTHLYVQLRRDIARAKTLIREKNAQAAAK
jgi:large subunit ribosomal protein L29